MRRLTARLDRFSCICTNRGAKCATEAYFGVFREVLLIVLCVPCCMWGFLCPDVAWNDLCAFARKNALITLLKWRANGLQTRCKRTANRRLGSVKKKVKMALGGHLEGQFGGTAKF